jgi:hypothetical protein
MKAKPKPTLTARERLLLLVLPGAAVLAVYALFVNSGHIGALTKANQQLEKLRTQTGVTSMNPQALASDLQRLKAGLAEVQRKLAAFSEGGSDAMQRSEAVVMVGALLRKHGLVVVEQGPSSKQATTAISRPTTRNAQQTSLTQADSVWQVRFLGTWSGVQATLEALPEFDGTSCLPLSLSMAEPQTASPVREWTLRLRL